MDGKTKETNKLAETVAQTKGCVLLQGEAGTGKTYLARQIHEASQRVGSIIFVNCNQQPEALLETEIFGFEKGAFAGTVSEKRGKFEQANGGTIVLENISELTPKLQAKILKTLESGAVDRIGSKQAIPVDIRVVATTTKNISEMVTQNTFSETLFYRLNANQFVLPPLRERGEDLKQIVSTMLAKVTSKNGRRVSGITEDAVQKLSTYNFPNNLRELEAVLERAAMSAHDGVVRESDVHLGPQTQARHQGEGAHSVDWEAQASWAPGRTLDEIERAVILRSLSYHSGNRTHTARELGISIRTLRNKLNEYRRLGISV